METKASDAFVMYGGSCTEKEKGLAINASPFSILVLMRGVEPPTY